MSDGKENKKNRHCMQIIIIIKKINIYSKSQKAVIKRLGEKERGLINKVPEFSTINGNGRKEKRRFEKD